MQRQATEWEKIFVNHVSDTVSTKICKELIIKFQEKLQNSPILKWTEILNIFQK